MKVRCTTVPRAELKDKRCVDELVKPAMTIVQRVNCVSIDIILLNAEACTEKGCRSKSTPMLFMLR